MYQTLKCIDFFCGGGGMSKGLSDAGIKVIGALDNDPHCKDTYEANHKDTKLLMQDITQMKPEDLAFELQAHQINLAKNDDDMLFVACSPCQYWSPLTGKSNPNQESNAYKTRNLLGYFTSFVEYYRPGFILLENVRGIARRNEEESGLANLKKLFDENGYKYKADVLKAYEYGVPQTRQRYVLIASRVATKIDLPQPTNENPTVRKAIGEMQPIEAGNTPPVSDPLHRATAQAEQNIRRLQMTPEGGTRETWANDEKLMINAYKGKSLKFFAENYGRMWWDKPGPAITTRFCILGCGRFGHPEQNRTLSLREGALLQTFPMDYEFKTTSISTTAKLIGNAVPPKLAQRIGEAILNAHRN